ncbi:MAG: hypothetical protein IJ566_03955 [Cardiobacteriaceae bacterium]|nr:hypothetical protein [Cardiobacteriaceae bacterium]
MNFIPFKQVGIFQLDDDVSRYSDVLATYFYEAVDEYGNEYYHLAEPYSAEDSHMLQVVDGKIRAVFCDESLIYNGINLIGLTIDELKNITNSDYIGEIYEADLFDDKPPMYDYHFDEIGITARTHYGRIVDIIASGHWLYEED